MPIFKKKSSDGQSMRSRGRRFRTDPDLRRLNPCQWSEIRKKNKPPAFFLCLCDPFSIVSGRPLILAKDFNWLIVSLLLETLFVASTLFYVFYTHPVHLEMCCCPEGYSVAECKAHGPCTNKNSNMAIEAERQKKQCSSFSMADTILVVIMVVSLVLWLVVYGWRSAKVWPELCYLYERRDMAGMVCTPFDFVVCAGGVYGHPATRGKVYLYWTGMATVILLTLYLTLYEFNVGRQETWGCMDPSVSYKDYDKGTCNFKDAPINSGKYDYLRADSQTLFTVVGIAVLCTDAGLLLTLIVAYYFMCNHLYEVYENMYNPGRV